MSRAEISRAEPSQTEKVPNRICELWMIFDQTKGQLIWKCIFGVSQKKRTKTIRLYVGAIAVKLNFFGRFMGEFKETFRNQLTLDDPSSG